MFFTFRDFYFLFFMPDIASRAFTTSDFNPVVSIDLYFKVSAYTESEYQNPDAKLFFLGVKMASLAFITSNFNLRVLIQLYFRDFAFKTTECQNPDGKIKKIMPPKKISKQMPKSCPKTMEPTYYFFLECAISVFRQSKWLPRAILCISLLC
jgi:hypothetical protein